MLLLLHVLCVLLLLRVLLLLLLLFSNRSTPYQPYRQSRLEGGQKRAGATKES